MTQFVKHAPFLPTVNITVIEYTGNIWLAVDFYFWSTLGFYIILWILLCDAYATTIMPPHMIFGFLFGKWIKITLKMNKMIWGGFEALTNLMLQAKSFLSVLNSLLNIWSLFTPLLQKIPLGWEIFNQFHPFPLISWLALKYKWTLHCASNRSVIHNLVLQQ